MASITSYSLKSGNKRYLFQVYAGLDPQTGKPKRIMKRGFKTKKEAALAANRLELQISQGDFNKDNNILFKVVYEQWYQGYKNTVRESTIARTAGMFDNHILPYFGNKRIRTITPAQIQKAVNDWFKIAPRNFKKWFNYTTNVFDYALKHDYMHGDNPTKKITIPKRKAQWGKSHDNFWDKSQLETFFTYINPNEELEKYTLFRVLAFAGIRRGECLALTWNDVNFSKSTMNINKTLTQGMNGKQIIQAPKTLAGRREITLDKKTLHYLKQWRALQKREYLVLGFNTLQRGQLIFANTKNGYKSLNTPAKWLKKIIKTHHLKSITVHGFRHTSASLLFEAGATIKEVQTRLGHDDAQTTLNIYTHVTQKQDNQAVEKLANFLNF
ncbi:tyrosine-type recombinase/integrase [Lentilactobacillus raoultii]|uniref:Tyrosine-type recombinase/integrase n=1 Tax=Lentilactobacillus raoultii TaxID=1987503 RepID=A0ABW3PMH5_9LACO|nr:site-specific integrase [Lentilactobacillus raoultii]